MTTDMENEIKNFKGDLYKIAWFMRGGITLDELFGTSHEDREVMGKVIKAVSYTHLTLPTKA